MTNKETESIESALQHLEFAKELSCDGEYIDLDQFIFKEDQEIIKACLEIVLEMVRGQDDCIPNEIWLQYDSDYPKGEQEITWCEDKQHNYDTKYIRCPALDKLKKVLGGE